MAQPSSIRNRRRAPRRGSGDGPGAHLWIDAADVLPGNIIIRGGDMARVQFIGFRIAHSTRLDNDGTLAAGFAGEPCEPVLDRIEERRPVGPTRRRDKPRGGFRAAGLS